MPRVTLPAASNATAVIVGLPRTGSTLLHNLLALEYGTGSLPYAELCSSSSMLRRRSAKATLGDVCSSLEFAEWADPSLRDLHPMQASWPEDCSLLLANTFTTLELSVPHPLPAYTEWL
jgi:hypothetical protein